MIATALAHSHATLHVHPETVALAAVCVALSLVGARIATAIRSRRRHKAR